MHRRALLALAASSLASLTYYPALADEYRVTGPVVHENLAIYLVRGKSAAGPVPLTLEEALAKGAVKVHETGNVNELQIENLGAGEVFVQSGDIVKGGQPDRVLTVSLCCLRSPGVSRSLRSASSKAAGRRVGRRT
jgi:hypothetical protein